jgi:dienelactone hydrolase
MGFGGVWGKAFLVLCLLLAPGWADAQSSRTVRGEDASGELFLPARTPAPLIFVLHTAWGRVSPADVQYSKMLAQAGFVAFAIEYPSARGSGRGWVKPYLKLAMAQPEGAGQPWGAVGFSAGGPRTFWLAAGAPDRFKAVVSYYGTYDFQTTPVAAMRMPDSRGSPIAMLDRVHVAALLLHGAKDNEVPVEMVERMKAAMVARGLPVEAVVYPDCYHDFDRGPEPGMGGTTSNGTYVVYNSKCEADARARTVTWFRTYLK